MDAVNCVCVHACVSVCVHACVWCVVVCARACKACPQYPQTRKCAGAGPNIALDSQAQGQTPRSPLRSSQFLDLSGNFISAQGCAAVAEVLGANSSIYALSLAGCPVRDEGAIAVAEPLKSNIGLFRLDLSGSQVGRLSVCLHEDAALGL